MGTESIFSKNLQELRKKQGVTQEKLASHLGVSPQAVSKWENGSYPEGDLLPKISDFFGVSISYLYGQEKEKVSIEQGVLEALAETIENNTGINSHAEYFDKMLSIAWAFQIGFWRNNKNYYDRGVPAKDNRTASVITDDAGFGFFSLNKENQFFILNREAEDGYVNNITISEDVRGFFKLLGEKGALEIVRYMLTLKWGECVTASNIAQKTGISEDKVSKLLGDVGQMQGKNNSPFTCIDIINKDGIEKGYGINQSSAVLFIPLLQIADQLINPPCGYQMQVNTRGKSWFDRDTVEKTH